jgi:diguanylate cyclase (GGDEF)-like protein
MYASTTGSLERGWLARRLGAVRRRWEATSFALRLFFSLGLALVLVGVVAYAEISRQLEQHEVSTLAHVQQADVEGFETRFRGADRDVAIREIDEILDAVGSRPGVVEASLVDPRRVIVASSVERLMGTVDDSPQIRAALEAGDARYGHEVDPLEDASDFEFVTPVNLADGRYALETSIASDVLARQLAGMRRVLALVAGLALLAVSALFYLLGGRSLLRSHSIALQRATVDGLTDLPNHRAFQADLEQAVAFAERAGNSLALAVLDVDHFKLVNDRYGHPQGDELLKQVAAVLRVGRSTDRAYRIGGDEFALLLPGTDSEGTQTLIRRLSRKLVDAGAPASIGVAALRGGESPSELRAEADAALYEAKRGGRGGAVHFDAIRSDTAVTTADRRNAVARLIEDGGITTVFQPIWGLELGELIGLEALSRPHERYGFSGPSEAFDVAAQVGLVHELDVLCATQALRSAADDLDLPPDVLLFVNLAPSTLERDAGACDWLAAAVDQARLTPDRIVIEVTERIAARVSLVARSIERLRAAGFKLALDDVGTGNSGLEMLAMVDADYVKIDRSIVTAAPTEPNARAVLMAMATFASQTGAFVIAEGIEDEETLEFLRTIEELTLRPGRIIKGGQGFKLGRPAPQAPDGSPSALAPAAPQAPAAHEA